MKKLLVVFIASCLWTSVFTQRWVTAQAGDAVPREYRTFYVRGISDTDKYPDPVIAVRKYANGDVDFYLERIGRVCPMPTVTLWFDNGKEQFVNEPFTRNMLQTVCFADMFVNAGVYAEGFFKSMYNNGTFEKLDFRAGKYRTTDSTSLRYSPHGLSKPVMTVPKYSEVDVISRNDDFYFVSYKNRSGYIHKAYLVVSRMENKPGISTMTEVFGEMKKHSRMYVRVEDPCNTVQCEFSLAGFAGALRSIAGK